MDKWRVVYIIQLETDAIVTSMVASQMAREKERQRERDK